jgi:hypothetical protein
LSAMGARVIRSVVALVLLLLAGGAIAVVGALVTTNGALDTLGMWSHEPLPTAIRIGPTVHPGMINPPAAEIRDPAPLNSVVAKRPLFDTVPLPQELSQHPNVIATNLFLALLLVIGIGSVNAVLHKLWKRHDSTLRGWFPKWLVRNTSYPIRRGCLGLPVIMLVFALYGIIFAFLEPGTDLFSPAGIQLALILAISVGLVSFGGDMARRWVARFWPRRENYGLYPANLLIALLTTLFSRSVGLTPGILFGVPGGADIDLDNEQPQTREIVLSLVTLIAVVLVGTLGWALAGGIVEAGKTNLQPASLIYLGPIAQLFQTLGLAIFVVAVQTAFFEMLPLTARSGSRLFRWNPLIWAVLLLPIAFVFAHTILNPNGDFQVAFNTPTVQVAVILLDVLTTLTLILWLYFALIAPFFSPRKSPLVGTSGVPWYVPPTQTSRPRIQPQPIVPVFPANIRTPHAATPDWMLETAIPVYEDEVESVPGDTRPMQRIVQPVLDTQPIHRPLTPIVYEGLFPPPQPGDEDYLESENTPASRQADTAPTGSDSADNPPQQVDATLDVPDVPPPDSLPL